MPLENFKIIVADKNSKKIINHSYQLWKHEWSKTFLELNHKDNLYSDSFQIQDIYICIMIESQCVGLALYKNYDLGCTIDRDSSYFKHWDNLTLNQVVTNGNKISALSYLIVDRKYRKESYYGLRIKDILVASAVMILSTSDRDAMCGIARNDRGANITAFNTSGIKVGHIPSYLGVPVDLIAFYKTQIDWNCKNLSNKFFHDKWNQRINCLIPEKNYSNYRESA